MAYRPFRRRRVNKNATRVIREPFRTLTEGVMTLLARRRRKTVLGGPEGWSGACAANRRSLHASRQFRLPCCAASTTIALETGACVAFDVCALHLALPVEVTMRCVSCVKRPVQLRKLVARLSCSVWVGVAICISTQQTLSGQEATKAVKANSVTDAAAAEAVALDQKILAAVREHSEVLKNLTYLSDEIG